MRHRSCGRYTEGGRLDTEGGRLDTEIVRSDTEAGLFDTEAVNPIFEGGILLSACELLLFDRVRDSI